MTLFTIFIIIINKSNNWNTCSVARCRHYAYVDVTSHSNTRCSSGYFDGERTELFDNQPVVESLKAQDMAHINSRQVPIGCFVINKHGFVVKG